MTKAGHTEQLGTPTLGILSTNVAHTRRFTEPSFFVNKLVQSPFAFHLHLSALYPHISSTHIPRHQPHLWTPVRLDTSARVSDTSRQITSAPPRETTALDQERITHPMKLGTLRHPRVGAM